MITLFRRNLDHHAVLLASIGVGLFLFEILLIWILAQLDAGAGLEVFLARVVPADMRSVMFEQFGLATFPGGVAFGFQHPFTLVGGIAAMLVIASIPAGERESGFLDLVLARPVPRGAYLTAIVALLVTCALFMAGAILAGAVVGIAIVEGHPETSWLQYIPSAFVLASLLLAIGGYTLLLATASSRRGPATTRAAGLTLLFYWLDFMGGLWDRLETAHWLSPFAYFNPADVVSDTGVQWRDPAALLTVAAVTIAGAYLAFRRQEL